MSARLLPGALSAVVLFASIPPLARAQIQPGAKAPPVEADEWMGHPPMPAAALSPHVVALVFVRLSKDECLFFFDAWKELRFRFALEPVTFLAITNETPDDVRDAMDIEEIDAPTLIDADDSLARAYDVQYFPSVVVVAPGGVVAFHGQPGSSQDIEDAIVEALPRAREFPQLPRSLRAVGTALDKWKLADALGTMEKLAPRFAAKPEIGELFDGVSAAIQALDERLLWGAEQAVERERWEIAVTALSRLVTESAGLPVAEEASKRLAALEAREDLADEIRAAKSFAKGERYEREREWKLAYRIYDSLAKTDPDTKAGKEAAVRAVLLAQKAKAKNR